MEIDGLESREICCFNGVLWASASPRERPSGCDIWLTLNTRKVAGSLVTVRGAPEVEVIGLNPAGPGPPICCPGR